MFNPKKRYHSALASYTSIIAMVTVTMLDAAGGEGEKLEEDETWGKWVGSDSWN